MRPPVALLVDTRITPDALTMLRLATGLAAALCFAHAGVLLEVGAGLFLLSALLDRADGELARQSRRFSRFGPRFDLVSDCVATMAIFAGLGIGVRSMLPLPSEWQPIAGPLLGLSAAVSVGLTFTELSRSPPTGRVSRPFDPDDMMLLVPPVIWCGGAGWILLASGLLTPLALLCVMTGRLRAWRHTGH
ncbi:CDP-alcohol phosphatidyltransferase family protein [Lichenicola sp.]|uniref:CDP-alcohol phosphatidyltransferase family protein n=1 Tax=Lichenicola sp. TaxID=2804529 RepID=UPI003AFFB2DB